MVNAEMRLLLMIVIACMQAGAELDSWQYINRGGSRSIIAANSKSLYMISNDANKRLSVLDKEGVLRDIDDKFLNVDVNEHYGVYSVRQDNQLFSRSGISSTDPVGSSWTQIAGNGEAIVTGRYGLLLHYNNIGFAYVRTGITGSSREGSGWNKIQPTAVIMKKCACNVKVCITVSASNDLYTSGMIENVYSPTMTHPLLWQKIQTGVTSVAASGYKNVWIIDSQGDTRKAVNVFDNDLLKLTWEKQGYQEAKFKDIAVTDNAQYAVGVDNYVRVFTGCPIFDFEENDFSKWEQTGTAFQTQPVVSQETHYGAPSGKVGDRLVDTHSSRKSYNVAESAPEATQGDAPVGTLTSPLFQIRTNMLHFAIGGGSYPSNYVDLYVEGVQRFRSSGESKYKAGHSGNVRSGRHWWDVTSYKGKCAYIKLVDEGTALWGYTMFDDLRASPPCFKGMKVILENLGHNASGYVGDIMNYKVKLHGFYTSATRPLSVTVKFPLLQNSPFIYIENTEISKKVCQGSINTKEEKNSSFSFKKTWHVVKMELKNYLLSDAEIHIQTRVHDHYELKTTAPIKTSMTVTVNYADEYISSFEREIEVRRHGNETAELELLEEMAAADEYLVGQNITYNITLKHNQTRSLKRAHNIMIRLFLPSYLTLVGAYGLQSDVGDTLFSPSPSQQVVRIPELFLFDNRTITFYLSLSSISLWKRESKIPGQFLVDVSYCQRRSCLNAFNNGSEVVSLLKSKAHVFQFSHAQKPALTTAYTKLVATEDSLLILCGLYRKRFGSYRGNCYYTNVSSNSWFNLDSTLRNVSHYNVAKKEIYGLTVEGMRIKLFGETFLNQVLLIDSEWNDILSSESSSLVTSSVVYDQGSYGKTFEEPGSIKHQLNCCKRGH